MQAVLAETNIEKFHERFRQFKLFYNTVVNDKELVTGIEEAKC